MINLEIGRQIGRRIGTVRDVPVSRLCHMQGWQGDWNDMSPSRDDIMGIIFCSFRFFFHDSSPVISFLNSWIRVGPDNAIPQAPGASCPCRRETSTTLPRFVPYISLSCHTGQRPGLYTVILIWCARIIMLFGFATVALPVGSLRSL